MKEKYIGEVTLKALSNLKDYLTEEFNNEVKLESFPNTRIEPRINYETKIEEDVIKEDKLTITVYVWLNDDGDFIALQFTISSHNMIFKHNFVNVIADTINNVMNGQEISEDVFKSEYRKSNNIMYHTTARLEKIYINL